MCLFFDTLYFRFFVFFNFSNVLSAYLNLGVCSFVLVFVVEVLFRLTVFSRNLLAGDVHTGLVMDRHVNGQAASPYSLEAYPVHLPVHLRPEVVAPFSYYFLQNFSNDFFYKTSEDLFLKVVLIQVINTQQILVSTNDSLITRKLHKFTLVM